MEIIEHSSNSTRIAELVSEEILLPTSDAGKLLLVDLYHQGFDLILLKKIQVSPAFFDLKSGVAGELLQTCSNLRIRLSIIGNFDGVESKSLRDFIFESNKGKQVNFVDSVSSALQRA